jgi:hypothetical protein
MDPNLSASLEAMKEILCVSNTSLNVMVKATEDSISLFLR